ncbi:MAG TPA: sugar porter family MFS transporter [Chitinispirillaceae bacterium]|nr:sugar porter family MFS transporter [Chitinispirillaceae bacterium]
MSNSSQNTGFIFVITLVATIGGFLFGFDSGVINGTVDGLKLAFNSDSVVTGFNVASMLLGCALGAFVAGSLADKFGRRTILIISAVFFAVSAWGSGIAHGSFEFIIYRLIGGISVGAASVLAPAYISEVAPAHLRGTLSSIQQIAIITGLFAAFLSNFLIARLAGGSTQVWLLGFEAWRWMFWMELIFNVLFFFSLLLIPESPRYLAAVGKKDQALAVLKKLMGAGAEAKYNEISQTIATDHKPSLKDIISPNGGIRPIVWLGIGLAAFQQFVGINIIFYYGAVLWQSAGFTESNSLLINVISSLLSIAACVVATFTIDKIGRKPMLLIGSIGMAITLGVMSIVFMTSAQATGGTLKLIGLSGPIALVAANLYVMFFNFSWGPVMWVMLGEMFPNQMRGSGLAVSGLSQWVANFAITMTFPIMLTGIGLGASYGIYALFAVISFFFVMKYAHETKGIELEKMVG